MASVLALLGPTASGKSAVAMAVARARGDIEIVAIDAFTIYRGMDIGTAKPPPADRAEVAHHLVDVLDPWDEVTVAWFQTAARAAIADIGRRGRLPLLVGGSGLYWRAVVDDLRFPPTDPEVRAELEARYAGDAQAAHAALVASDPEAAARIDPQNLRRSIRALEVAALTGQPFSSFANDWDQHVSVIGDVDVAYLEPHTTTLRSRIESRARAMVAAGLLEEVAALRAAARPPSTTAAQAIGYAEAAAVLDGELQPDELVAAIADRTWRYAKRQRSWFRRDPRCVPTELEAVLSRWT